VIAADHPGSGDRSAHGGQEDIGKEKKEIEADVERQKKDPVIEDDPEPDDERKGDVG